MAKQKKQKKQEEYYVICIENWEISHNFTIITNERTRPVLGNFREDSTITIYGKITNETEKKGEFAKIQILKITDPASSSSVNIKEGNSIGFMNFYKKKLYNMLINIFPPFFTDIYMALIADKIKFIIIGAESLKYNSGIVHMIELSTTQNEE